MKKHIHNKSIKHTKNLSLKNPTPPHRHTKKVFDITFKIDNSTITGTCPLCLSSTYDDPSNLIIGESIFHFDCVVNWIKSRFEIQENNKILYIGSNTFGIFWESRAQKLELLRKINISEELKDYVKNSS